MSFIGLGVGDVVLVSSLAFRLYQHFKSAPRDFEELAFQLMSISQIIDEIKNVYEYIYLNKQQRRHLQQLLQQSHSVLTELDGTLKRYGKDGHVGGKWQILKWHLGGTDGLNQLEQRLVGKVVMLTHFNTTVAVWSLRDIKKNVNRLVEEKEERLATSSTHTAVHERSSSRIHSHSELPQVKEGIEEHDPYVVAEWLASATKESSTDGRSLYRRRKDTLEETTAMCLFCESNGHQSKECECLDVFDPKAPPSGPEPIPIPCRGVPSTHSQTTNNSSIRRGSATLPSRTRSSFASSFGMDSSTAYGFSLAPGMQFSHSQPLPKPTSSVDSNSISDQARSRDGSVATEPGSGKRRSLRSFISNKIDTLGSSAPSVNHGLSI